MKSRPQCHAISQGATCQFDSGETARARHPDVTTTSLPAGNFSGEAISHKYDHALPYRPHLRVLCIEGGGINVEGVSWADLDSALTSKVGVINEQINEVDLPDKVIKAPLRDDFSRFKKLHKVELHNRDVYEFD